MSLDDVDDEPVYSSLDDVDDELTPDLISQETPKMATAVAKKSAGYMKKFRSEPDNVLRENKAKIFAKIRERPDYKAQIGTLKKYGIMPEEVTVIRKELKFVPNDLYTTVANTRAKALKLQQDNIKEQEKEARSILANNLNAKDLSTLLNTTMPNALKGKAFTIANASKFTFKSLKAYFYEFEGSGKGKRAKSTLGSYFGTKDKTNTGKLYKIINRHSPDCAKHDTGFKHCFVDMKGLIESIMVNPNSVVSTKLKDLEVLSLTMREYPPIDIEGEFKPQYDLLQAKIKEVLPQAEARKLDLSKNQKIDYTFTQMTEMIRKQFGDSSLQYLFMRMFNEFPIRDNFGNLHIKTGTLTKNADDTWSFNKEPVRTSDGNFLVLNPKKSEPVQIVFQDYKTNSIFGVIVSEFSKPTSDLIKKLGKNNSTLFGEQKKLTTWVKEMLLKAKVKSIEETKKGASKNVGNLNLLRHAYISEKLTPDISEAERVKLANSMKHSPVMSVQYVRAFNKEASQNEQVLDVIEKVTKEDEEVLGLRKSTRVKKPSARAKEANN